jgi:hypothetical protein
MVQMLNSFIIMKSSPPPLDAIAPARENHEGVLVRRRRTLRRHRNCSVNRFGSCFGLQFNQHELRAERHARATHNKCRGVRMSKQVMPSAPTLSCAGLPRAERGCLSRADVASLRALRAVELPAAAAVTEVAAAAAVPFNFLPPPPLEGRAAAAAET